MGGAAAALLAGYPAIRQIGTYPETVHAHLTPMAAEVYRILGDFVIPPGGPLPGSGGDAIALQRLDRLLGEVPADVRTLLLALPLAFEHGTALEAYGARRMSALSPDRQLQYLQEWADSDDLVKAQLFMALRSVLGMAYFERGDVLRAMGVSPGCGVLP